MRRPELAFLLTSSLLLQACSYGQVYEGLRERERNLCAEGPAVQYDQCLEKIELDYHEYEKKPDKPGPLH
jgi:hypothetical protein